MPLNISPEQARELDFNLDVEFPEPQAVGLSEQMTAALRLDNTFWSVGVRLNEPSFEPEPEFNPADHLLPGEDLMLSEFVDAKSTGDMALVRQRFDSENDLRLALEEGPMNAFLATGAAILVDPLTYIPIAGVAGKARTAVKLARMSASTAAGVGASELVLQATQQNRSVTQSIVATILGGGFGFALGSAAIGLGKARTAAMSRMLDRAIADSMTIIEHDSSAGAQQVRHFEPDDTKLAPSFLYAEASAKLNKVGLAAPGLEGLASKFSTVREFTLRLVDTGLVTRGMLRGVSPGVDVQTKIKSYNTVVNNLTKGLKMAFSDYKKGGGKKMSRGQFYDEVGKAMRRSDQSTIPQVAAVAKQMRKNVFDPLLKASQKMGLVEENVAVVTAPSYFHRVWLRDTIKAEKGKFLDIVEGWLREAIPRTAIEAEGEYRSIATDIANTIMGNPAGRVPFINIPRLRGPMKDRTFNIPDELVERFLEDNALEIGTRYVRTMAADIELTREFGRADFDMELGRKIQDEVDTLIDAATTAKERTRLQNDANRQIAVMKALYGLVRGTGGLADDPAFLGLQRLARFSRNVSFVRLLGSVVISSIPDVAMIGLHEGIARTFGTIIVDAVSGFRGIRMGIKQAQLAGTAFDMTTSARARAMMDLGERNVAESKLERAIDAGAQGFSNIVGLNAWNTMMKGITSVMVSTRILKTVEKLAAGKSLSSRETRQLAKSRIDPAMALRIAKESDNWQREGVAILGDTEAWKDAGAREAFHHAVLTDVDNTIITPGAGDAPLWTSTEWGKTIFQFKKFGMASNQRVLIAGLQARDAQTLMGIMSMIGMGILGTHLRDVSNGKLRDRTPAMWVADGADRSGVLSMFFELDALAEKWTPISPIKGMTGEPVSRFAARGRLAQALGPTAGFFTDTSDFLMGAFEKDFTQSDLHRARRLLPLQNHMLLTYLLNQVEAAVSRAAGFPKIQPREGGSKSKRALPGDL